MLGFLSVFAMPCSFRLAAVRPRLAPWRLDHERHVMRHVMEDAFRWWLPGIVVGVKRLQLARCSGIRGGRRGVDGLRHARRRPIAPAVVRRAQVRAALHHLSRDAVSGERGSIALRPPLRPAGSRGCSRRARSSACSWIPVGGPLPDVARPCRAARSRWPERSRPGPSTRSRPGRFAGELALPGVAHPLAAGGELVAPRVFRAIEPAARGEFPLGFSGEPFAGPFRRASTSS